MNHRFVIAVAIAGAFAVTGRADAQKVKIINRDLVDHEYVLGAESQTKTARTLSTATGPYAIHGLSRNDSALVAHSSVTGAFVTSNVIAAGDDSYFDISTIKIDGARYADTSGAYSGATEVANGIAVEGEFAKIEDCLIEEFHGSAVVLDQGQILRGSIIENSLTGIECISGDLQITDNIVHSNRDYGLHVAVGGNVYSAGNHFYNHHTSALIEAADVFRANGDIYADANYGMDLTAASSAAKIDNCFFQHCPTYCARVAGAGHKFNNCTLNVQRLTNWSLQGNCYGFVLLASATRTKINDCDVHITSFFSPASTPTGAASGGIYCEASGCKISCQLSDNDGVNGTQGIVCNGAIQGLDLDVTTFGFHDAAAQVLTLNSASSKAIRGTIRGAGLGSTGGKALVDYFTLPEGWDGSLTVIDTTTGTVTTWTGPTAR